MPSLIVNVVGNTAPLKKELKAANTEIASFSQGFVSGAAKASIFAAATYTVSQNLEALGGSAGRVGKAINQLMTGNVVGFVKTLQDNSEEIKRFNADLVESGDAAKAGKFAYQLAAAGLDDLAAAALEASKKLQAVNDAYVDVTKIRDSTSPGAIAAETSGNPLRKPPPGATQAQRNKWFDSMISRELNQAQDDVAKLRQVEAEIKKRISLQKDKTRLLNLEDQLLNVQRKIEASQAAAAKESARLAAERKRAEEARLAALKERQRNRQMLALGLGTPGVANLKKQLDQLSSRSDIGSIPSKMEAALEGARNVLAGKWGEIEEDSRSAIQSLFDTIRAELNKGSGRNLTASSTINSQAILGGLGLDRSTQRALAARLSAFNTSGTANSASAANAINLTMNIDGRPIEASVTRNQQKRARANPPSRRG